VERTIEFILKVQAKAEARAVEHEERMAKLQERMAKAETRMDKFDRRTVAIQKLIQTGMRMLARIEQRVDALTEAQRKSDIKFERLMDALTK